jgi:hypothetical protein
MNCPLCGGAPHPCPDTRADQFGLICPGPDGTEDQIGFYLNAITQAYLNYLSQVQEYVDEIARRKQLWYERTRSEVTQEELQADCDLRVAERHPEGAVGDTEPFQEGEGFDVDIPHLTVPGKVPTRRLSDLGGPRYVKSGDEMMFMPTAEETPDGQ